MDLTVFRKMLVENVIKSDVKVRERCFTCYKEMMIQGGRNQAQKITRQVTPN